MRVDEALPLYADSPARRRKRGLDHRHDTTDIVKLAEPTWIHDCFGPHFLNRKSGRLSCLVFVDIAVTVNKLCGMLWFNITIEDMAGLL